MRATFSVLVSLLGLAACGNERAPAMQFLRKVEGWTAQTNPHPGVAEGAPADGSSTSTSATPPRTSALPGAGKEVPPAWHVVAPGATHIAILNRKRVALAREGALDVEIAQPSGVRLAFRVAARGALEGEGVVALVASPNAITAAADGAIRVFEPKTGARIRELLPEERKRAITGLVTLRDGSVLASSIPDRAGAGSAVELSRWGADGTLRFTAPLATRQRWTFGGIDDASLSPDGARIVTGVDQVTVVDAATGAATAEPFGYLREDPDATALIRAVTWSGGVPVACSAAGSIGSPPATIHILRRDSPARSFDAHPAPSSAPRSWRATASSPRGTKTIA